MNRRRGSPCDNVRLRRSRLASDRMARDDRVYPPEPSTAIIIFRISCGSRTYVLDLSNMLFELWTFAGKQ